MTVPTSLGLNAQQPFAFCKKCGSGISIREKSQERTESGIIAINMEAYCPVCDTLLEELDR